MFYFVFQPLKEVEGTDMASPWLELIRPSMVRSMEKIWAH